MSVGKREMAAFVLEAIGTDLASRLFFELDKREQLALLKALSSERGLLSDAEIESVYADFVRLTQSESITSKEIHAKQGGSFAGIELPHSSRVNEICGRIPDWILADYLKSQLDSVVSVVLGLVEPSRAGRLFKALPDERHARLMISLSTERVLEAVLLDDLESDLEELALKTSQGNYGQRVGGGHRVVELMQALEPKERERLILELEVKDPSLAKHLETSILSVERLAGILPVHLSQILAQLKDAEVGLFLKGEKSRTQDLYLACLSSRRRADVECLLDSGVPVTQKQKAEACDKLRNTAQRMKDEGRILFPWEEDLVS